MLDAHDNGVCACMCMHARMPRVLACGQSHTVLLTDGDEVVGWGDNTNGQLALPAPSSSSFLSNASPVCHVSLCVCIYASIWMCLYLCVCIHVSIPKCLYSSVHI